MTPHQCSCGATHDPAVAGEAPVTVNLDHLAQARPCCSDFTGMEPGSYRPVLLFKQAAPDDLPYSIPVHAQEK